MPQAGNGSKKSDPAWKQYSLQLKIAVHTATRIKLIHGDSGMDMSDLVNSLLEKWNKEQEGKKS